MDENAGRACSVAPPRRGEGKLGNDRLPSSGLQSACSQVQAAAVFLVLWESVRGWKCKNYGLENSLAIRGNSSCKGRGPELGKRTIYWPLPPASLFAELLP